MGIEELRRLSTIDKSDGYRARKREQQAIVRKLADAASMIAPGETASCWPEMLVQGNRRWLEDEATSSRIESVLYRLGANVTCSVVSLSSENGDEAKPGKTKTRPVLLITAADQEFSDRAINGSADKAS